MQTFGSTDPTAEREAELRRRNEEIEMRQAEAVRIARDIIQTQEAKLATSPSSTRSASRRNKVFDERNDGSGNSHRFFGESMQKDDSQNLDDSQEMLNSREPSGNHRTTHSAKFGNVSGSDGDTDERGISGPPVREEEAKDTGNMGSEATIRYRTLTNDC